MMRGAIVDSAHRLYRRRYPAIAVSSRLEHL
jgi:hypothetical protein